MARNAKLSNTLAGMAILQFLFLFLLLGPFLGQRFVAGLAFEDAARGFDQGGGHGFEEDSIGCRLDHGFCAFFDVKLLSQPGGDNDLAFGREPDRIRSGCCCAQVAESLTFSANSGSTRAAARSTAAGITHSF